MRTTLTIDCDIREAQEILYTCSKIIEKAEDVREQERLNRMKDNACKEIPLSNNNELIFVEGKGCLSE